jgi:ribonuclease BN (tRNA processing enzyme)
MYSGDSDECLPLVELAREADLAVIECALPTEKKLRGHLTPDAVGRIAAQAQPCRLLLTHMYPACDGHDLLSGVREAGFHGRAELATDGLSIELSG